MSAEDPKKPQKCHGAYRDGDEHLGVAEEHDCPYSEIAPRDPCNCCDGCTHECAMDV